MLICTLVSEITHKVKVGGLVKRASMWDITELLIFLANTTKREIFEAYKSRRSD